MPRVELSKQAAAFLKDLPTKQARQIAEKLILLAADPAGLPTELLRGYAPMRRLKAGEFRVVFVADSSSVQIRLIGKRNDDQVYKMLSRTS
jgi:mRNA interferase RelE/StbE